MMQDSPNEKLRTLSQNNALHKWCEETAVELNNAGISMKALVANIEVDHTKESVKSIWRAIAKAKWGKDSTTELSTRQINEVYEELNRLLAKFGLHIPFPSAEWQFYEE